MNLITILLAEDHAIVREGLRALLNLEPDFKLVGEAENGQQAVDMASELCPDVIVMDMAMPLINGLEATRQILQRTATSKVLILSAHTDQAYVEQVIALGASGYLSKQNTVQLLPGAIREVHKGNVYFHSSLSQRCINHEPKVPGVRAPNGNKTEGQEPCAVEVALPTANAAAKPSQVTAFSSSSAPTLRNTLIFRKAE